MGLYEDKKTTAAHAVQDVRSGDRVFVGSGCAEPESLVRALSARGERLTDVEVVHLLTLGTAEYIDQPAFRHNAFFIGGNTREAVREGRADYTPIFLSEIPHLIRSGLRRVDVALLQLSAPDRHGDCSMGVHVDVQRAALQSARLVIAEINPRMPRTFGDTVVNLSELDHIIEVDTPLITLPRSEPDEISVRIGGFVARLIPNGACLQMGIGTIPDAVLSFLARKKDLGVHTEMFSDGLLDLLENGNVTNRLKTVHTGKTVASFSMGTQRLYDHAHENQRVVYYASDYVNDPRVISRNDNVVAVNSALQIDLTGQVCADSLGYRFFSGIGGQVDFIRGAAMSRGGKPIIAIPSTAADGRISRIAAHLDEGAGVVTSRGDVHYVVTEYGVAYLHGKTIRERALALIGIAHPDFRAELLNFVKRKHYVYSDEQVLAQLGNSYPGELEQRASFAGQELTIRPLRASDERRLQEFFYSHTPETVYARYFAPKKALSHREAAELCCVDYRERMALGAFLSHAEGGGIVAVARYFLHPRRNTAETATVVHEGWRRRGIGRFLVSALAEYAHNLGIRGFYSEILASNHAVVAMHRSMGHRVVWNAEDGLFRVQYDFGDGRSPKPWIRDSNLGPDQA